MARVGCDAPRTETAPVEAPSRGGEQSGAHGMRCHSREIARTTDERKIKDAKSVATGTASIAPERVPSQKENRVARVGCDAPRTETAPVEAPSQGGEQSGAHGMRCHTGAGAAPRKRERKGQHRQRGRKFPARERESAPYGSHGQEGAPVRKAAAASQTRSGGTRYRERYLSEQAERHCCARTRGGAA